MATSNATPADNQPNYNVPSEYHLTISPLSSPVRESLQAAADHFNTPRGETLHALPPLIPHLLQTIPENQIVHRPSNFHEALQALTNAADDPEWRRHLQRIISGNAQLPESPNTDQETLYEYDDDEDMPDASTISGSSQERVATSFHHEDVYVASPQRSYLQQPNDMDDYSTQPNVVDDQGVPPRYATEGPFEVANHIMMLAPNDVQRLRCLHRRIMQNREAMLEMHLANDLITGEIGSILRDSAVHPSYHQDHDHSLQEEWRLYAYRLMTGEHAAPTFIPLYPIHPMHTTGVRMQI
ncbi:hypothetical protein O0I10_012457 [Lichtheimia ornata]|uniref:Uncharacterized protein n=1 Tax=Lichtheimia ornata TaxID=688661 RepID=A0AAD7XVS4_9FUNG|nr:uncharacterized protein O0I10_012457 [Lichtheimia ornata]KAJ8651967.1 hypothetical protein O0I10_012457 [Lichtheimia ornata]